MEIYSGLISLITSAALSLFLLFLIKRLNLKKIIIQPATQSYSERLTQLTWNLRQASMEVDSVLSELAEVARNRETAVSMLEEQLKDLESKEKTLQQRIEHLKGVPLPVAEYFAKLTEAGERRSARRDYMLFSAGVLVSTVISILFFIIQGR